MHAAPRVEPLEDAVTLVVYKVQMRNPDYWQPPERQPDPEPAPTTRRGALIGLVMIVLLVLGGLFLTHTLGGMARLQDCALSGRSNCGANP